MNLLNNSTAVYCVDTLTERGAKQKVTQPIKEVLEVYILVDWQVNIRPYSYSLLGKFELLLPPYLHDVVGQGKEGGEGEGGGEHGDEAVLDHQLQVLVKQGQLVPGLRQECIKVYYQLNI